MNELQERKKERKALYNLGWGRSSQQNSTKLIWNLWCYSDVEMSKVETFQIIE